MEAEAARKNNAMERKLKHAGHRQLAKTHATELLTARHMIKETLLELLKPAWALSRIWHIGEGSDLIFTLVPLLTFLLIKVNSTFPHQCPSWGNHGHAQRPFHPKHTLFRDGVWGGGNRVSDWTS